MNQNATLTYTLPGTSINCIQTVNFTGNVSMVLTVHADNTVTGTATAVGTFKSTTTNNTFACPLQTVPVNQTVNITGVVDHFTAALNIGQFPGTLVGELVDENTIVGQVQVANPFGGPPVVLPFTLSRT